MVMSLKIIETYNFCTVSLGNIAANSGGRLSNCDAIIKHQNVVHSLNICIRITAGVGLKDRYRAVSPTKSKKDRYYELTFRKNIFGECISFWFFKAK